MNSGSAATKAVARLVLLDGQFSHLPDVVAEGRQVIANIERVSMLFLTKTVYATALAILFGVLVLEFPFLPRQLSITDGLTIGIPAFFLALMPNAQRYVPGFLRRSLTFAIPAGIIVALGLTCTPSSRRSLGVGAGSAAHGGDDHPRDRRDLGARGAGAPAQPLQGARRRRHVRRPRRVFTIPLATEFFELVDPGEELAIALTGITIVMIAGIEIVRLIHRRLVSGLVAPPAPSGPVAAEGPAPGARGPARSSRPPSRCSGTSGRCWRRRSGYSSRSGGTRARIPTRFATISLIGAGITLLGLLVLSAVAGLRRGSGFSRLLVTIWFSILVALSVLVLVVSDRWDWGAAAAASISVVVVILLWTPPPPAPSDGSGTRR